MKTRHWRVGAVAALALLAAPALAQQEVSMQRETGFDGLGLGLRGGLSTYTGWLGGATDPGALFGVQGDVQALRWVGLELGYEGNYNNLSGGNESGALWRHNVGALAKVGPVINAVRPFAGVGFGVSFIDPNPEADLRGYDEDTVTEVPLAAGVDYQLGDMMVGARATFHLMGSEDFAPVDTGDLFDASITFGGRF